MSINKEIPELLAAGVITKETASKIQDYYNGKANPLTNKLFIVFGILGAILVGLGVILILAHNWDELSRTTKVIFAFLPLVLSQLLCGYVLLKQNESTAWRETAASLLFFAIGASIALIGQIYNIPGNLNSFVLTWMILALPLIYLLRSSATSIFYIIGITCFGVMEGGGTSWIGNYVYWALFLLVLPYYYLLYKRNSKSNFLSFHNWLVPASVVCTLGTTVFGMDELLAVAYMCLFGILYLIGDLEYFAQQKLRNNGFRVIGAIGTMVMLLGLSFEWFWEDLSRSNFLNSELVNLPDFWIMVLLFLLATVLFIRYLKRRKKGDFKPIAPVFALFLIAFIIGIYSNLGVVLVNLYVLVIGILTMREGVRQDHLVLLNYGLLTIAVLIACRFFDTDLSFVIRGLLFILIGVGFFAANYFMLQKRKKNELS